MMSAAAMSEALDLTGRLPDSDRLLLRLDGFEGPLDLLLELARTQKIDLATISIVALIDQYVAVIESERRVRLEVAAEWLVMAAWLTWLKSRLLVPASLEELEEGEEAAEGLAARLRELNAIRTAAAWLGQRPMLGRDVFARGAPEDHTEIDRSRLTVDLTSLVSTYVRAIRRGTKPVPYRPRPLTLWTVKEALERLASLVGSLPSWSDLEQFLPDHLRNPVERRAAVASTLLASLEMARSGAIQLRQDEEFGPILLRRADNTLEDPA